MIRINDIKIDVYQVDDDRYIDIVTNNLERTYEAYIYNADEGTKELLFGMPIEQQSYDEFLAIVKANI